MWLRLQLKVHPLEWHLESKQKPLDQKSQTQQFQRKTNIYLQTFYKQLQKQLKTSLAAYILRLIKFLAATFWHIKLDMVIVNDPQTCWKMYVDVISTERVLHLMLVPGKLRQDVIRAAQPQMGGGWRWWISSTKMLQETGNLWRLNMLSRFGGDHWWYLYSLKKITSYSHDCSNLRLTDFNTYATNLEVTWQHWERRIGRRIPRWRVLAGLMSCNKKHPVHMKHDETSKSKIYML